MSLNTTAFKWNLLQTFGMQLLNLGVSILLARLLGPKEFGIVALAMVFISFGQTIMNGGLSESVIRLQKPTSLDYNSLFFLNLLFSIVIYLTFFFSRNVFASFMEEPLLETIIPVLSIIIIINSFSIVQATKLNRELNFKKQFLINIPATIFSSICGLFFAFNGYGVFSLIYMQLIFAISGTLVLWVTSDYIPSLKIDLSNLKKHFKFGFPLTINNLFTSVANNINSLIIGKYFSVVELGLYNRSKSLKELPVNNFINIANKNLLPMYANNVDNQEYLMKIYGKVLRLIFVLFVPLTALLVVNAEFLIKVLLGNKWLEAIPYFQVLMLSAAFEVSTRSSVSLLKVVSGSTIILKKESFYNILYLVAGLLSIHFGIYFLLFSLVFISLIKFISFHYAVKRHFKGNFSLVFGLQERIIIILAIVGSCILFFINNLYLSLIFSIIVVGGPSIYILSNFSRRNAIVNYFKNL